MKKYTFKQLIKQGASFHSIMKELNLTVDEFYKLLDEYLNKKKK